MEKRIIKDHGEIDRYLNNCIEELMESLDNCETHKERKKVYLIIDYLTDKIKENILKTPIDLKKVC